VSPPLPGRLLIRFVELYVLLRNPAVVRRPLKAAEAAALCQAFQFPPATSWRPKLRALNARITRRTPKTTA